MGSPIAGILNEILIHIGIGLLLIAVAVTYGVYLTAAALFLLFMLVYASVRAVIKATTRVASAVSEGLTNLKL